jgi:NADPH:quinone reductase-like Zn-dependent oxidoreductase
MRAAQFDHPGSSRVINIVDVPDPSDPGPNEVLVEVRRMAINGADLKSLAGWFPDVPFPRGLGREFAGAVRKVGSEVSHLNLGDMVIGTVEPAMQDYVVVDSSLVMPIPSGIGYDVGSTLPVAGQTAWFAVESQRVAPGEVCVVSGASGGVGSIIIQLLVNKGATVVAIAREHHHETLEAMGALPIGWSDNLADSLAEHCPQGIHHVFDQVGPVVIEAALQLGVLRSAINSVSGYAGLFGVPSVGRVGLDENVITQLASMIREGRLSIATFTMPFEEVSKAMHAQKHGSHFGKAVLSTTLDDEAILEQVKVTGTG